MSIYHFFLYSEKFLICIENTSNVIITWEKNISVFLSIVCKKSIFFHLFLIFQTVAMVVITKAMCWKVVAKARDSSGIGLVIYQKPTSSSCYKKRKENNQPLCENKDGKNSSWYFLSFFLSFLSYFYDIYIFLLIKCLRQRNHQTNIV